MGCGLHGDIFLLEADKWDAGSTGTSSCLKEMPLPHADERINHVQIRGLDGFTFEGSDGNERVFEGS